MKLTIRQKRTIVRLFVKAYSCNGIAQALDVWRGNVEDTIRDYINGKFSLKPKGKRNG